MWVSARAGDRFKAQYQASELTERLGLRVERRVSSAHLLASFQPEGMDDDMQPEMHRLSRWDLGRLPTFPETVIRSSISRAVVGGVPPRIASPSASLSSQRILEEGVRSGSSETGDAVKLPIRGHHVNYVEVEAALQSCASTASPAAAPVQGVGHVRGRRLKVVSVEDDVTESRDIDDLRPAARSFLQGCLHTADHKPRRLLSAGGEAHVLFATSPTALPRHLALEHGLHDVPEDHNDFGAASPPDSKFSGVDAIHYFECLDADGHDVIECFLDAVQHAQHDATLVDDLLAMLHPIAGPALRAQFPNALARVASVAATVGSEDCQEALAASLLAIDGPTPEILHPGDTSDFHSIVEAFTVLEAPLPVSVDAILSSMEQHQARLHQYNQLLLTLGTVASHMRDDDPTKQRAITVLVARFDAMLAANQAAEEHFLRYRDLAEEHLQSMGNEELFRWMAACNRVSRGSWEETWDAATDEERVVYRTQTVEATAKLLAQNLDNTHDGYGIRADYSQLPQRRLEADGTSTYVGGSDGHHASALALLSLQAADLRYAVQALANLGMPEHGERLLALSAHRKKEIRASALHALVHFPSVRARRRLIEAFSNPLEDRHIRSNAVESLMVWPDSLVNNDAAVQHAVLEHFGRNAGMDWHTCEVDCTEGCVQRDPMMCRRACSRKCLAASELESAIYTMARARLPAFSVTHVARENTDEHARRLSGSPDVDRAVAELRHQGARRFLSKLTEADLEARFISPFQLVRSLCVVLWNASCCADMTG